MARSALQAYASQNPEHPMSPRGDTNGLDRLARDLATGEISRRTALRRLAGAGVGVAVATVPGASALGARASKRCPPSRRCGEKCCPKNAKCKRGKCKCVSGYAKCGRKCVDLQTSAANCGSCGSPCDSGEFCVEGECVACRTAADCPISETDCKHYECSSGTCTLADDADGQACGPGATWACAAGVCECTQTVCEPDDLCVSLYSDSNCGGCGRVCPGGQACLVAGGV